MLEGGADYIVAGAGSAGAIMAERLSADGRSKVLLLEAGPSHRHPFVTMPKGISKILGNPRRVWFYNTEAYDDVPSEPWYKGKLLGGSSSINGMMYFRGQMKDYDDWASSGAHGWESSEMSRVFASMENHSLGAGGGRGVGGPLNVTMFNDGNPLSEAFIRAGEEMGVPRVDDLNNPAQEGVGYAPQTIRGGRRVSTARSFLERAEKRPNLHIETGVDVDRVLFDGTRAVGVRCLVNGVVREFRTEGEVILCAGAINSPVILQRSGVGNGAYLSQFGIQTVADRPQVGEHLLEHRTFMMHYGLNAALDENAEFRGPKLLWNGMRYFLTRSGPMASPPYPLAGFFRTQPNLDRPDVQIIMAPFIMQMLKGKLTTDDKPSMHVFAYPCRPISRGSVRITSADPAQPPAIRPGYLTERYDQEVTVRGFRFARAWMRKPAIAKYVAEERGPIATTEKDEDIVTLYRAKGQSTFHSCGTCRMGGSNDDVLDEKLRVRGVSRLRVADASVMPAMPSSNTNGPSMAVGWRGAELILAGRNR